MRVSVPAREPAARYGERRLNPLALGLAVLVHIGLILLLLTFRGPLVEAVRQAPLVVHTIKLDPPPPRPERPLPDPPPPAAVYVPRPALLLPLPPPSQPAIATTEQPVPPQPAVEVEPAAAPAPAPAQQVTGGDLSSSMIHAPPPRYPYESRRKREQGTVLLAVVLGTDGNVLEVRVARSSGHARLDEAARSAVGKWRWSPTMRGGVAVQVKGTVEIPFVLTG